MRPTAAVIAAIVVAIALAGCGSTSGGGSAADETGAGGGTSQTAAPTARAYSADDAAYKLAVLDGHVEPTAAQVAPYDKRVSRIARICDIPRIRVADYAVTSRKLLAGEVKVTLRKVLRGFGAAVSPLAVKLVGGDCKQIFAAFTTTLRASGGR